MMSDGIDFFKAHIEETGKLTDKELNQIEFLVRSVYGGGKIKPNPPKKSNIIDAWEKTFKNGSGTFHDRAELLADAFDTTTNYVKKVLSRHRKKKHGKK